MEVFIGIIVGVFILIVVFASVSVVLKKLPWLKFVIGLIVGLYVGIHFGKWWLGLLAGFFMMGALASVEAFRSCKCAHCGSYDTEQIKKNVWQCNKCKGVTYVI